MNDPTLTKLATPGGKPADGEAPQRTQKNGSEQATLPISGMTCAACVGRVERALSKAPGVDGARVNLATERASIRYDPAATSPAALADVVRKTGYDVPVDEMSLTVQGMTCAACVGRVERALRKVEGVLDASVNLATERAVVRHVPGAVSSDRIEAAVRDAGYNVLQIEGGQDRVDAEREAREAERLALRRRLFVAAGFTVPILLLSMGPMLVAVPATATRSSIPASGGGLSVTIHTVENWETGSATTTGWRTDESRRHHRPVSCSARRTGSGRAGRG